MSFANFIDLDFDPKILKAIQELGYVTPTPIQQKAIPEIVKGLDLIASAQTGTGKSAAFLLPILNAIAATSKEKRRGPRALILAPTRELAMQLTVEAGKYSKHLPQLKTVCITGGVSFLLQNRDLSRPYDILIATPGRLLDHMERGRINLSQLGILVLDEADRMLDMGFVDDVEKIARSAPKEKQTLLFSATLDRNVVRLSKELQNDPVFVEVEPDPITARNIEQRLYYVDNFDHKMRLLEHLLQDSGMQQGIIFTATKNFADELSDILADKGFDAEALHGGMNQRQRTRTISRLRRGDIQILIATDVAARGIDVAGLSHVINFDIPTQVEDYVHRIGRTGRAGATGIALTFVGSKEHYLVPKIEQMVGQTITPHTVVGMEPKGKVEGKRSAAPRRPSRNAPYPTKKFTSHRKPQEKSKRPTTSRAS